LKHHKSHREQILKRSRERRDLTHSIFQAAEKLSDWGAKEIEWKSAYRAHFDSCEAVYGRSDQFHLDVFLAAHSSPVTYSEYAKILNAGWQLWQPVLAHPDARVALLPPNPGAAPEQSQEYRAKGEVFATLSEMFCATADINCQIGQLLTPPDHGRIDHLSNHEESVRLLNQSLDNYEGSQRMLEEIRLVRQAASFTGSRRKKRVTQSTEEGEEKEEEEEEEEDPEEPNGEEIRNESGRRTRSRGRDPTLDSALFNLRASRRKVAARGRR
jgi:hypothetical protein